MKLKNRLVLPLLVVGSFGLVVAAGCKKSSSSSNAALSATIGSTNFSTSTTVGVYEASGQAFDFLGVSIAAGDSSTLEVGFIAPPKLNYAISSDTSFVDVDYSDSKSGKVYEGGSFGGHAIVTITAWDSTNHKVSGTFTGVVYNGQSDSLVISNGHFNTSYTAEP